MATLESVLKEEDIKDAVRFSSFAQRVKMAYWKEWEEKRKSDPSGNLCREAELDKILLHAFDELNRSLKTLASELVGAVPENLHECHHRTCLDIPCADGAEADGWNACRSALLSEIKKRGLE